MLVYAGTKWLAKLEQHPIRKVGQAGVGDALPDSRQVASTTCREPLRFPNSYIEKER